MKPRISPEPVESFGAVSGTKFGLRANAKTFNLLFSKLYKNKPEAVVRELSTNAVDSHRSAGCPERPFLIELPSSLSPMLTVRDYGTGMSHEDFVNVFTVVSESTKDTNDVDIGMMGLGCKSPFSITSQFHVNCYDGETVRRYLCYLDNGEPNWSSMSEGPSDEERGVEIVVPIDLKKFPEGNFRAAAQRVYRWFPVCPIGIGVDAANVTLRGDRWGVDTYTQQHQIVMGLTSYPIDAMQIPELCYLKFNLTLFAEVGTVDVQAGREELSYDGDTIQYIRARVQSVIDEIRQKAAHDIKVAGVRNALEYFHWYNERQTSLSWYATALTELHIYGEKIVFGVAKMFNKTMTYCRISGPVTLTAFSPIGKKLGRNQAALGESKIEVWTLGDLTKRTLNQRLKRIKDATDFTAHDSWAIIIAECGPDHPWLNDLLDQHATLVNWSERKSTAERSPLLTYEGRRGEWKSRAIIDDAYYVESVGVDVFINGTNRGDHYPPLMLLRDKPVYIVPKTKRGMIRPTWRRAEDALAEKFTEMSKDKAWVERLHDKMRYPAIDTALKSNIKGIEFTGRAKKIRDFLNSANDFDDRWVHYARLNGTVVVEDLTKWSDEITAMLEAAPLLSSLVVGRYVNNISQRTAIAAYVDKFFV